MLAIKRKLPLAYLGKAGPPLAPTAPLDLTARMDSPASFAPQERPQPPSARPHALPAPLAHLPPVPEPIPALLAPPVLSPVPLATLYAHRALSTHTWCLQI